MLSLEELNSAATFPAEAIPSRIQVEWRVMNERRSHLLSLGLLHTMRRRFNGQRTFYSLPHHVKSVRGKGMTCWTIFFRSRSVDGPHPEPLPRSQLKGRRAIPFDKAGSEVYPQSSTNGRVKASEKKMTSYEGGVTKTISMRKKLFSLPSNLPFTFPVPQET